MIINVLLALQNHSLAGRKVMPDFVKIIFGVVSSWNINVGGDDLCRGETGVAAARRLGALRGDRRKRSPHRRFVTP